jgi:predicted permease
VDWIRILMSRCSALFRQRTLDAELEEELRAHVDLAIVENIKRGMSSDEARTAALRAFGGVTQVRETYRTNRGFPWPGMLAQDLGFGLRVLWKNPGFTAVAVMTLAVGIGANTAIFSIVNGVLLNPLPFHQPDRLVALHESKPNFENGSISYPNFLDWRKENRSFSSMGLARRYAFSLTGRGDAVQVNANFISSDFFGLLGVYPLKGREFSEAEELTGAAPVALISEGLWRRKFNAEPGVLGQSVTLDGKGFTVVGVIPSSFHLRVPGFSDQDVYAPIGQWSNPILMNRGAGLGFHGIARLKPGVSVEQARADMAEVTRRLATAYPDVDQDIGASIVPLRDQIVGDTRGFLLVLLTAVGFVLLIVCVNVASLLLARSASRSHEFAVRAALGASRRRIVCQLMTESLLLGLAGGAVGLLPAVFGLHAALHLLPAALPRADEVGMDYRVLVFTTLISLVTSVAFGLVPAFRSYHVNPQASLKGSGRVFGRAHHRALSAFVVVETAIALVLLTGAGLMIRSLVRLWNVDPGFNPRNVLNFGLSMSPSMVGASPDRIRVAFRDLESRLAAAPGIKAVAPVWEALPMAGDDEVLFWIDGQPKPATDHDMSWAIHYVVGPGYLDVMRIPILRGRFFTSQDDENAPRVAIVDEAFARKFFPQQEPIGKRIHLKGADRPVEIIGVVGHVKQWGLDLDDANPLRAEIYIPCMQMPDDYIANAPSGSYMVVRYAGSGSAAFEAIRRVSKEISAEQVIYGEQTMESLVSESMASRRFAMILLATFAGLALMLACIGIYGVMSYLASQRTQELGIRLALGAKRTHILGLVLGNGARLSLAGIGIGLLAGLGLTRLMENLLFGVSSTDPLTLTAVSVLLMAVALAACYFPARHSASIDPMSALRTE